MLFTCILYCSDPEPCPPSPLSPRHCNVLANRWTTQHVMMARILKLKKPLVEYFRRHSSNERKLNSHEWKVTNEVCSLLDVVAEVTIRIQGGADTHLSQTMFNMSEIHEIFGEDSHAIRKLDQAYNGVDVETEEMAEEDLTAEAQQVRRVLLSKLAKKKLGTARMPVERICALLDPQRKDCSDDHFINGGEPLKTSAIADVKNVAKTFVDSSNGPAPSATGGGSGAGGSGSGGDGSNPPAPKKAKKSYLEERRLKRLAKHKESAASSSSASPSAAVRRAALIGKELRLYMAEDVQPEGTAFSLLEFWKRRRTGMPFLALIARLYNGIESTSCQAERNFSALAFLIGHLRSTTAPGKVERLIFLRLNRLFIPDIKALHDAVEAKKAAADRCKERVAQVEAAAAGSTIVLQL